MRRISRLFWFLLVLVLLWFGGFLAFIAALPETADAPDRKTDAIVALTGGAQRVAEAMRLMAEGSGQRLLVTGVHDDVLLPELVAQLPDGGSDPATAAVIECCVDLGYVARDTSGNARETAAWMHEHGFTSLRLVTADYHMPRSLLLMRCAMPDVEILAHPVFPQNATGRGWFENANAFAIAAAEYVKYWATRLSGCAAFN
ncbi:MAG: YdcF family protein [Dongiaceae bacterium]